MLPIYIHGFSRSIAATAIVFGFLAGIVKDRKEFRDEKSHLPMHTIERLKTTEGAWQSPDSDTGVLGVQRSGANYPTPLVPFYIYDHPALNPDLCKPKGGDWPRAGYVAFGTAFVTSLRTHQWRVLDPARASLFVVPFDVEDSFYAKHCKSSHFERLNAAVAAIESSEWFTRNGGRDHIWPIPLFRLPAALTGKAKWRKGGRNSFFPNLPQARLLRNMTIGRYLTYHLTLNDRARYGFQPKQRDWLREEELWGCTTVMPILTPVGHNISDEYTFKQWDARPILLHFRGGQMGGSCYQRNGEATRHAAVALGTRKVIPNSVLADSHAENVSAFRTELKNTQYCLVFPCDDPQTSRFFDAIASGCIPVVINDAWRVAVAPLAATPEVNYGAFVIHIPERLWLKNSAAAAHMIYGGGEGIRRRRFEALMHVRRHVLWHHPKSLTAEHALRAAAECNAERLWPRQPL